MSVTNTVTRTITERNTPAPIPATYTRTIDGVEAIITIPEPQAPVLSTSTSTMTITDH